MEQPTRQTMEPEQMSRRTPRRRRNKGEYSLVVVCAILGFLLAAQLKTVEITGAADATNASRLETLQEMYNGQADEIERLNKQLQEAQGELKLYRDEAANSGGASEALRAEVERLAAAAGLTDVEGPGVAVVMQDSTAANVTGDESDYIIHDNDLLSVINELRSAGAEAISLNGERIMATSEIRCTGAVVTVNGRRYAPPYVIFAIGDATTLYNALTMRNGVVDVLSQWKIDVKVTASDLLLIPKYNGVVEHRYAQTVEDTPEQEEVG